MKLHPDARTTPHSRTLLVTRVLEQGWTVAEAAEAAGISPRTVYKWLRRFNAEGPPGLLDRPSTHADRPIERPLDSSGGYASCDSGAGPLNASPWPSIWPSPPSQPSPAGSDSADAPRSIQSHIPFATSDPSPVSCSVIGHQT